MDRNVIDRLMQVREYPAVSILCPTHRTSPDNRRDPIQLKELVREARRRLLDEYQPREIEPFLKRLEGVAAEVDHTFNQEGLAIFVSEGTSEVLRLPFTVAPRVVIDETFATRDLVYAMNRSHRYRLLLINPVETRLFEGGGGRLHEVEEGGFPLVESEEETRRDEWWGVNPDAIHDERRRRFAREVAQALHPIHDADPLPLVLVGGEPWISLFNSVSRQADQVIGTIPGILPAISVPDLKKKAEPVVAEWRERERARVLKDLDRAVGANRYASGLDQVWRAARRGLGSVLLVEEGYHQAARVKENGLELEWTDDVKAPDVIDDIVDEIVETVISKGGKVLFYPDGALDRHQRIALITRG